MAKKNVTQNEESVDPELIAKTVAKAVAEGDIVNFRLLFAPFSPARRGTSEQFESPKYRYLIPDVAAESTPIFQEALKLVRDADIWKHVCNELDVQRPPQYPFQLLLLLGDNAVREGKYSSAAQAYELLRIRRRMQENFYDRGLDALEREQYPRAVRAFLTASGLAYDYAAFPDPMPVVSNFQTEALKLHGVYPSTPEDCIAVSEENTHIQTALEYLLPDSDAAARLAEVSIDKRRAFLQRLIETLDPEWPKFAARYREACRLAEGAVNKSQVSQTESQDNGQDLEREIEAQADANADAIPACLLDRSIEGGAWWQYLKELAYRHPASVLFIVRYKYKPGAEEILVPRTRKGSQLPSILGLVDSTP